MIIYLQADQRFRCFIVDFGGPKDFRDNFRDDFRPSESKSRNFPSLWLIQRYEPVRKIIFGPKLTHKRLKQNLKENFSKMNIFDKK